MSSSPNLPSPKSPESSETSKIPNSPESPKNHKKGRQHLEQQYSSLLPYLSYFFSQLSIISPCEEKKTMPHSIRQLHKIYKQQADKPYDISLTTFQKLWKKYFKKDYRKAKQRDGLCQLCEIGHKLQKQHNNNIPSWKKAIVDRHKIANTKTKEEFEKHIQQLNNDNAILMIDFKENITIGCGPRELGQSWYSRERRSVFGIALLRRNPDGNLSKWHFNVISECLAHDAIFVKLALIALFETEVWKQQKISHLSIWCDNAPHFKNKVLLHFLSDLCFDRKMFQTVNLCFFEAYHGKSYVDGMFGIMSRWVSEWKKTQFINSTDDLLSCFRFNNQFLPTPHQNFFFSFLPKPTEWTEQDHFALPASFKVKNVSFFSFSALSPKTVTTYSLNIKQKEDKTVEFIEFKKIVKTFKKFPKKKISKEPKYSQKSTEGPLNSHQLTDSDNQFLRKRAQVWAMDVEI
jgi:hypothetical protein